MTDADLAERLTRRRARIATVFGVLMIVSGTSSFGNPDAGSPPGGLGLVVWITQAAALLVLLASGGGLWRGRAVRGLLNDETTVEHRRSALATAFWAVMLGAFFLYTLSLFKPFSEQQAIRMLITVGVSAALLTFAGLERRSLK